MSFVPRFTPPPSPPPPVRSGVPWGWLLIFVFVAGYLVANSVNRWRAASVHNLQATPQPVVPRGDLAEDEQSTIELFRNNSPAVVYITTAHISNQLRTLGETTNQGSGAGFIWTEEGYVVTNDHVIAGSNVAQVTLVDQSVWPAELVGRAPGKDLAVLKIAAPADRLHRILVGSSEDLLVGQKVYAIGNPFGLDQTLTTGVISALDRRIAASEMSANVVAKRTIDGVIQTDAAINPGNSGGPLLDSHGRLIGVNTAIYSPSGAYAGVGFAIPVDTVNRIVPQLIRHGRIIRPDIGILPFRDQWTRQWGLVGVLVRDIEVKSTADLAGLLPTRVIDAPGGRGYAQVLFGDLIVEADDSPIKDLNDWFTFLEKHQTGDRVTLKVIRAARTPEQEQLAIEIELEGPSD
ncbi:MAG: trypsin-like peptidase domain-containing protein [Planctomycetales bacterium]|nr:trypsin-like peptidase domain-containing protein [Planctomycetales bacterium]